MILMSKILMNVAVVLFKRALIIFFLLLHMLFAINAMLCVNSMALITQLWMKMG